MLGEFIGTNNGTVSNCYYDSTKNKGNALGQTGTNGKGTPTAATTQAFASAEVCYLLNDSSSTDTVTWKQTLATDEAPSFNGMIVYYDGTKYYNKVPELTITLTTSDVTIENLSESATLIVASYNGNRLVDIKTVSVSADGTTTIASMGLSLTNADTIKAFLWKDMLDLVPLCESKSV